MRVINENKNMIEFDLEERSENLYDVMMCFNMVPYIGVYSSLVGFVYCSLPQDTEENQKILSEIANEIRKFLDKEI